MWISLEYPVILEEEENKTKHTKHHDYVKGTQESTESSQGSTLEQSERYHKVE